MIRRLAMKIVPRVALACALVSVLSFALSSQTVPSQANVPHVPVVSDGYGVTNIAGQPFSADLEVDRTQTLADGSHVHNVQHMKVYRDGEGRMRREMYTRQGPYQQGPEELSSITITDTPANAQYSLLPQTLTARRSVLFAPHNLEPALPRPVTSQIPQPSPLAPKHASESLGTQTIEGIVAEGHRNTTTWPVNSQGNDAPMVSVIEQWQSAEMGLEVLLKINDPRTGETVHRFTNIMRSEPDPSLFQVPADYTIKDSQ
jgi:hypothetical protein